MTKHDSADDLPLPGMPTPADVIEFPDEALAQLAVRELHCTHCDAEPGVWCRTRKQHGAVKLHAARMLVAQAIFELGYEYGRHVEQIARNGEGEAS